MEWLSNPIPWYIAGPLIGLTVPLLLLSGNKSFGISSNLRHLCTIALPRSRKHPFFQYNWRQEKWNLIFVVGLMLGGLLAGGVFENPEPVQLSKETLTHLQQQGLTVSNTLLPAELFGTESLQNPRAWLLWTISGLLVGFGARWAGGCTSGHAITGLSQLQLPSLIAVVGFFAGGLVATHFLLGWFL